MSKKPKLAVVKDEESSQSDGRRQRSQRSREKILKSMWELMLEGDMRPSAAAIAERAEVGLRSVFRHFEDLDTLLRELMLLSYDEITPAFMAPYKAIHWKEQLLEKIGRDVMIWERIRIPHTAGEIGRFKSEILMDDYQRSRMIELSGVKAVLPKEIPDYDKVLLALDVCFSFSTIRRLREDRKLSLAKTKETISHMVHAIIDGID